MGRIWGKETDGPIHYMKERSEGEEYSHLVYTMARVLSAEYAFV